MPTFSPMLPEEPTTAELSAFATAIERYLIGVQFTLRFLGDDESEWQGMPNTAVTIGDNDPFRITLRAMEMSQAAVWFELRLRNQQLMMARADTVAARAGTAAPVGPSGPKRVKPPTPTHYLGKKGDLAYTFLVACNNYRAMDPSAFSNEEMLIRWALQLMEDKSGQWAIRQLTRMADELDANG